jgi:hypothetical protein
MKTVWSVIHIKSKITTYVRFEIFTMVTMRNVIFWNVLSRGSCKNRWFGGTYPFHLQGENKQQTKNKLAIASKSSTLWRMNHYMRGKKTHSVAFSSQANYTDWLTVTCRRNLMPTFVDRGVSRGQHGGSPAVVNLSFLDRTLYEKGSNTSWWTICHLIASFLI